MSALTRLCREAVQRIKNRFVADNITEALSPVLFVMGVIGIPSYRFRKASGKLTTELNLFMTLASGCCHALYFLGAYKITFDSNVSLSGPISKDMMVLSYLARIYISIVVLMITNVISYTLRTRNLTTVNEFLELDASVSNAGAKLDYTFLKRRYISLLVFLYTVYISYSFFTVYLSDVMESWTSVLMFVVVLSAGSFVGFVLAAFLMLVDLCSEFLVLLNHQIEKVSKMRAIYAMNESIVSRRSVSAYFVGKRTVPELYSQRIKVLWHVYEKICSVCDAVSDMFSTRMLVVFAGVFILLVFGLFNVFGFCLLLGTNGITMITILIHGIQVLYFAFILSSPIFACNRCKIKFDRTVVLINHLLIQETDENICDQICKFSTYLLHRRPNFTAFRLFNIDNSLFFTMIGAITVYLVILIQMYLT